MLGIFCARPPCDWHKLIYLRATPSLNRASLIGSRTSDALSSHARLISMNSIPSIIDPQTANATKVFLERISKQFPVDHAILFGSRARNTHNPNSDADLAVILNDKPGNRSEAAIVMAGVAFDVLLDTGILVQALPLWHNELAHPEQFSNPALIDTIRREGIRL